MLQFDLACFVLPPSLKRWSAGRTPNLGALTANAEAASDGNGIPSRHSSKKSGLKPHIGAQRRIMEVN